MRRSTLLAIIGLFLILVAASIYQLRLASGGRRYPGPGVPTTPTATTTRLP